MILKSATEYILVMFRDTPIAAFAMFTPQWHADHAWNTKIVLIKLPKSNKLVDHSLLLCKPTQLGYISRLEDHGAGIEICAGRGANDEGKITERMIGECCYQGLAIVSFERVIEVTRKYVREIANSHPP